MQLHQIKPLHKGKSARRVGRGGKRGTYSGRGIKGLHARAGAKLRPAEREILKKIPKLRGYRFRSFRKRPVAVNITHIAPHFTEGEKITPALLIKKGIVQKSKGRVPQIKILGNNGIKKRFVFEDILVSRSIAERSGIASGKN